MERTRSGVGGTARFTLPVQVGSGQSQEGLNGGGADEGAVQRISG